MTRTTFVNSVLPIIVMAVLGALLGLCWRDPRWAFLALPIALPLFGFSTDYGFRGQDATVAAKSALRVGVILSVVSAVLFAITQIGA